MVANPAKAKERIATKKEALKAEHEALKASLGKYLADTYYPQEYSPNSPYIWIKGKALPKSAMYDLCKALFAIQGYADPDNVVKSIYYDAEDVDLRRLSDLKDELSFNKDGITASIRRDAFDTKADKAFAEKLLLKTKRRIASIEKLKWHFKEVQYVLTEIWGDDRQYSSLIISRYAERILIRFGSANREIAIIAVDWFPQLILSKSSVEKKLGMYKPQQKKLTPSTQLIDGVKHYFDVILHDWVEVDNTYRPLLLQKSRRSCTYLELSGTNEDKWLSYYHLLLEPLLKTFEMKKLYIRNRKMICNWTPECEKNYSSFDGAYPCGSYNDGNKKYSIFLLHPKILSMISELKLDYIDEYKLAVKKLINSFYVSCFGSTILSRCENKLCPESNGCGSLKIKRIKELLLNPSHVDSSVFRGYMHCETCNVSRCTICGVSPYHRSPCPGMDLSTLEPEIRTLVESGRLRKCPGLCGQFYSKQGSNTSDSWSTAEVDKIECDKMICHTCGIKWCFRCTEVLNKHMDPYAHRCTEQFTYNTELSWAFSH